MQAAVITDTGDLEIQARPIPEPTANEILVRVYATALNRADLLQRAGNYPPPPGAPKDIPGLEFAGEVVDRGSDVTRWSKGDRVFGIVGGGAQAEYLVVDADAIARIPHTLDWTSAAAVPEAFITAHDALLTQALTKENENVLIHAVGSGVGLAGVQLARAWRAVPYGTARTPEKIERARALGLENGLAVSEDVDGIAPVAETWTAGRGFHVTLDLVGGLYLAADVRAAAPRGRIMIVGSIAGRTCTMPIGMILGKRLTLRGTVLRSRSVEEKRQATEAFARDVVPLLESQAVMPTIDSVFSLAEIRQAYERLESNTTFGKVVVRVD